MADEARLIFELIDRSGAGTANANVATPGAGVVPGATLAQDFQQQVTSQGAGAKAGQGSSAGSPVPEGYLDLRGLNVPSPATPPAQVPTATPAATSTPTGDNLLPAVRAIVGADENTTAEELQKALGIATERAERLLEAARNASQPSTQTSPVSPPPTPPIGPSTPPSPPSSPPASPPSPPSPPTPPVPPAGGPPNPPNPGSPTPPAGGPVPSRYTPARGRRARRLRRQRRNQAARQAGITFQRAVDRNTNAGIANRGNLQSLAGIGGSIASQFGRLPAALSGLVNAGASLIPASALAPGGALAGLGGLATAAGPLAAVAGVGVAAIGVGAAAGEAIGNEAARAIQIARPYSAEIAREDSLASIRQTLADMRTAQTLGDEAARFVRAGSRASSAGQGIRDTLAEPILDRFGRATEGFATLLEKADRLLESSPALKTLVQEGMDEALRSVLGPNIDLLLDQLAKMAEDEKKKGITPYDWFGDQPHLAPSGFEETGMKPAAKGGWDEMPGLTL